MTRVVVHSWSQMRATIFLDVVDSLCSKILENFFIYCAIFGKNCFCISTNFLVYCVESGELGVPVIVE